MDYSIWRGNNTAILHTKYEYRHWLFFERQWRPIAAHAWFSRYWHHSITIAIVYILGVHWLQHLCKRREPMSLRSALVIWNALLAVFSAIACVRFSEEFIYAVTQLPFASTICYSIDPTGVAAFWSFLFAMSKVAELFDTVFVVLRKRPLIFLHWYHHAVVLIYSWHAGCELTAAGRWFIWMNYSVHSVMYTYYAIRATGRWRIPRRISMIVTTLQTAQMLIGVCISICVYRLKMASIPCQQSFDNLYLCFAIYATFALLFIKFFYTTYIRRMPTSYNVAVSHHKEQ